MICCFYFIVTKKYFASLVNFATKIAIKILPAAYFKYCIFLKHYFKKSAIPLRKYFQLRNFIK